MTASIKSKQELNQQYWSNYRRVGRITECFYHDKASCKGNIKQSHSLQRNGRLSLIEGDDGKGNQVIYTFTNNEADERTNFVTLKPMGKATASTFFGFCDFHDTELFSQIENFPFDDSDLHCFLHSYRSFAHSYHRHKEFIKFTKTPSHYTRSLPRSIFIEMLRCAEMGLKEMDNAKQVLDEMIESKNYSNLEYLTYILPQRFPIACSSIISPESSYKGTPMNNNSDHTKPFSQITLTVLPDALETIIILSCFSTDTKGKVFLDELVELADVPFRKAMSSLMINKAENTFFAPALWNKLGKSGQKQLCLELEEASKSFRPPRGFVHSKINFFDPAFSAASLGL